MEQKKIDRINELARKAKAEGLTDEEIKERDILRREYIDSYKASLVAQLEHTYIVDDKGNKTKVTRKNQLKEQDFLLFFVYLCIYFVISQYNS